VIFAPPSHFSVSPLRFLGAFFAFAFLSVFSPRLHVSASNLIPQTPSAQAPTGEIAGTVYDASGGVVPNASIKVSF